ncbi:MAG: hypothetical protein VB082_06975 [Christensenella sp.]|nr:hypothetical protein [Christensenella sp.]
MATGKEKAAKVIRTVTVPPVQVCLLLVVLFFCRNTVFSGVMQLLLSLLFLMVIPALAYPLAAVIPHYRRQKREGQRKLAFLTSAAGYAAAVVYGLLAGASQELMLVYWCYFFSVVTLLIFNRLVGVRASGHACSIAGPLILAVYLIGWGAVAPCVALFAVVAWSSLVLKRHTGRELAWGSACAAIAFAIALVVVGAMYMS